MLEHLEIQNFALIENLSVDFHEGFNVITGETGAGKSIILGALGLLMGEKAESSAIRTGAEEITVNALISIPENHEILPWLKERNVCPEDNAIIVKRVVKLNGRSVIYVQNQLFTRSDLTFLADSLIDMHGQSEHQSLLLADRQRKIVDSYAGNESLINSVHQSYNKISDLKQKIEETRKLNEEAQKNQDYLSFVYNEIENAKILQNEDEELKEKIGVISQYESIFENLQSSLNRMKESKSIFYDSLNYLAKAAKHDSSLNTLSARLENARIETEDISNEISLHLEKINYSEDSINAMQERLSLLQKLKRKYGPSLEDVVKTGMDAGEKLKTCKDSTVILENLNIELQEELATYGKYSAELTAGRKRAASDLQKKIEETLRTLGMPDAVFRIDVVTDYEKVSVHGSDSVSFMISANTGESVKELKLIASGGELSRVMLALKTVLAGSDTIQTQVFDEVDSGIGGSVALSLARCISQLSKQKQVIAITHLASIASIADSQFVVRKTVENGKTYSNLTCVSGEERVREVARMLAGDESEVSLTHARQMLNN